MATFHEQIVEHARQNPEREALVDESLSISFGELPALIEKYQTCLQQLGLSPGSTVGLTIRQEIPHLLVSLALLKAQMHQVILASHETKHYRGGLVQRLNISHVLHLDDTFDPLAPKADQFQLTRHHGSAPPVSPRDPTIYSTTSGTTKGPRIIAATEQLLGVRADRRQSVLSQRVLMTLSVEHNLAKRRRLRSLYLGAPSLFYQNSGGGWADLADYLTRMRVTLLQISPLDAWTFANGAQPRARVQTPIVVGGARVPWTLRKSIQENLSDALYVLYGASECGAITVAGPGEHDERECVGKPQASVPVQITDGKGGVLPNREVGEIRVKAAGAIQSYYDDPAETAARFRDGWFYPGDMGVVAEDGQLIVQGRKDDMMMMNSINVYPSEIERIFEAHPGVSAAAAFPIKSRIHGDIPAVAVELRKGSAITENILMDYCRDRLGLRYPRKIFFVQDMPRDPMGKILKKELVALMRQVP